MPWLTHPPPCVPASHRGCSTSESALCHGLEKVAEAAGPSLWEPAAMWETQREVSGSQLQIGFAMAIVVICGVNLMT